MVILVGFEIKTDLLEKLSAVNRYWCKKYICKGCPTLEHVMYF